MPVEHLLIHDMRLSQQLNLVPDLHVLVREERSLVNRLHRLFHELKLRLEARLQRKRRRALPRARVQPQEATLYVVQRSVNHRLIARLPDHAQERQPRRLELDSPVVSLRKDDRAAGLEGVLFVEFLKEQVEVPSGRAELREGDVAAENGRVTEFHEVSNDSYDVKLHFGASTAGNSIVKAVFREGSDELFCSVSKAEKD